MTRLRNNNVNSDVRQHSILLQSCVHRHFMYQVLSLCFPCVLTHLFVVKAVVRVRFRVLVGYEVSKAPHGLLCQPLPRVQILLLRAMLLDHLSQNQSSSCHCEALSGTEVGSVYM